MQIVQWKPSCSTRTDGHDEANKSLFCNFMNVTKNKENWYAQHGCEEGHFVLKVKGKCK